MNEQALEHATDHSHHVISKIKATELAAVVVVVIIAPLAEISALIRWTTSGVAEPITDYAEAVATLTGYLKIAAVAQIQMQEVGAMP